MANTVLNFYSYLRYDSTVINSDTLILYGLTLDIIGVLLLAVGAVLRRQTILYRSSRSQTAVWGGGTEYNAAQIAELSRDTVTAWLGATVMIIGFIIQSVAYVFSASSNELVIYFSPANFLDQFTVYLSLVLLTLLILLLFFNKFFLRIVKSNVVHIIKMIKYGSVGGDQPETRKARLLWQAGLYLGYNKDMAKKVMPKDIISYNKKVFNVKLNELKD